jgi:hypothetical protein
MPRRRESPTTTYHPRARVQLACTHAPHIRLSAPRPPRAHPPRAATSPPARINTPASPRHRVPTGLASWHSEVGSSSSAGGVSARCVCVCVRVLASVFVWVWALVGIWMSSVRAYHGRLASYCNSRCGRCAWAAWLGQHQSPPTPPHH